MANLQRIASLRFSVFEAGVEIGLVGSRALDGFIDTIEEEEDESQSRDALAHSSDDQTDSPYLLTPPSADDNHYRDHKQDDGLDGRSQFGQGFPNNNAFSAVPILSARPLPGKLRKPQTPQSAPPVVVPVQVSLKDQENAKKATTQQSQDKQSREREKNEKSQGSRGKQAKDQEPQRQASPIQRGRKSGSADEDKKGFAGLLRFRTKSKERKAAKVAAQNIPEVPKAPQRPLTPPELPIAGRFARTEEISFRPLPLPRDSGSGSSHGASTSVSSMDDQDSFPKPRDHRSSRFERVHPAWRTSPSTATLPSASSIDAFGMATERGGKRRNLPSEIFTLPPGQTMVDRKPKEKVAPPANVPPPVNMDVINKYYGLASPISSNSASGQQPRVALTQALDIDNLVASPKRTDSLKRSNLLVPATNSSRPSSPSPFIVPSPAPSQAGFENQVKPGRSKRAGLTFIPPTPTGRTSLVPPKRPNAAYNPPPTPPPTTDLPPTPIQLGSAQEATFLRPITPSGSRVPSPLGSRPSTANGLAPPSPAQPSPSPSTPVRPGTAPSSSGAQRGKTPAFPVKPQGTTVRPHLLNRRPEYDPAVPAPRNRKVSFDDHPTIMFERGGSMRARRSTRYSTHQGGYDSDDESRYSRDTYYRDSVFYEQEAREWGLQTPPLPENPPKGILQPSRSFSDLERERTQGREKLVRMFAGGGGSREV